MMSSTGQSRTDLVDDDDDVYDEAVDVTQTQGTVDTYSSDNEFDSTAVAAANRTNDDDGGGGDDSLLPTSLDMDAAATDDPMSVDLSHKAQLLPPRPKRAKASIANDIWNSGNILVVILLVTGQSCLVLPSTFRGGSMYKG